MMSSFDRVGIGKRLYQDEQISEGSLQMKLGSLPYHDIIQRIYGNTKPQILKMGGVSVKDALRLSPHFYSWEYVFLS